MKNVNDIHIIILRPNGQKMVQIKQICINDFERLQLRSDFEEIISGISTMQIVW